MSNRFIFYNPNPHKNRTTDCAIRAICKATGYSWNYVQFFICMMCGIEGEMPERNWVWGKFLQMNGFKRYVIARKSNNKYTLKDFCEDNPVGTFVVGVKDHVVCVVDGCYYDTWDSGDEEPIFYWVR